jgi:hypothetical protein
MGRRLALTLLLVTALLAGCAGAETPADENAADTTVDEDAAEAVSPEPPAASPTTAAVSCEDLADELVAQLQVIVNELSDATMEDLAGGDVVPEGTQQELDDLEQRVSDAGCDDEIEDLLAARADRIEGAGVIADAVREALNQNQDLPF